MPKLLDRLAAWCVPERAMYFHYGDFESNPLECEFPKWMWSHVDAHAWPWPGKSMAERFPPPTNR